MRRVSLSLAAAVAMLALTGCPPTYPKCSSDESCKEHNEVCVQGQCQECAADTQCKGGFVCDQSKCVPKPECTTDTSCPGGGKCKAGKCAAECVQDSECGQGKCRNNKCTTNACTTKSDCPGGQECEEGVCSTASGKEKCSYDAIRFDFNDASLSAEARSQLTTLAECIKSGKGKVRLEGHADERGTEEYNLQLSNHRANSVKKYLADLGVSNGKLDVVGYGANRPANSGHTEEAWSANRRVELKH